MQNASGFSYGSVILQGGGGGDDTLIAAAQVGVQLLGEIQHHDAAIGLARQAVLSPWPAVRNAAAEQLRTRPRDHYVPLWLAELSTPIESRIQAELINGRILYRHEFARETQAQRQATRLDTVMDRRPSLVRMPAGNNGITDAGTVAGAQLAIGMAQSETRDRALADAQAAAYGRELERMRQNQLIDAMNERLFQALAAATGVSLPRTAQAWWSWWDSENEVALSGDKSTDYRYLQEVQMYEDLQPPSLTPSSSGPPADSVSSPDLRQGASRTPFGWRIECFVAGTPVWTITGAVDIEKIRVGDLVLSQDPNTGELRFQPVLQTSQRPPEPLVIVRLASRYKDALEGSGGHPLWVAGEGWVKLRDLKSGMVLHGVDGSTVISDVEPSSTQETFNLVVAEFHTYVVGDTRILCHDNTPRRPTSVVVPGLVAR